MESSLLLILSTEFSLGDRLINIFPSCFSFHSLDCKNKESRKAHICKLNKLIFQTLADSKTAVVVLDAVLIKPLICQILDHYRLNSCCKENF